ncbi:glycosyltransferase family 25 protein [Alteromonas sp. ASW11-130]|uniref:glycosyltransferase family 25 protein n=1 Tax=Alteromonas sp. ASW11-130 TaxID=3015775 RepID=UPI002242B8D6|nr:glycosyltransferase family 25 protein [Alteromonas sp. ASW11-130]
MPATIPCFVINLDRSKERLSQMATQFSNQAIEFERISAIDGAKIDQKVLQQFYSASNPLKYYKQLNAGEICCYLSHRKVWQKMIDENIPAAIIFEDDIEITGDLVCVSDTLTAMNQDWDYIKLAEHSRRRKVVHSEVVEPFSRVIYDKVPARTCAQAVSLAGARKLLTASEKICRPIDIDLQYWWEKDLRIFGLQPYPVRFRQESSSEIDRVGQRSKTRKSTWLKVRQQLEFIVKNSKHVRARLIAITNKKSPE